MAIFQKAYKGYSGELTPPLHRTLVIFRYALADVFKSRLFIAFFAICFLPSLIMFCIIYLYYNFELLLSFQVPLDEMMTIDGTFFAIFVQYPQMFLIFVMILTIGPTMISPDLRNNAMPLYLSRSINKASYVFGKLLVLLVLGSLISWIPSLMLIILQASLSGDGWLLNNLHIPFAAVVSSLSWIVSLSLLAFAVSACVKWKAVSRLFFFGIFLLGSALGEVIKEIFGGWGGSLANLAAASQTIVVDLYAVDTTQFSLGRQMPFEMAVLVFFVVTSLALFILTRRIRAFQVVS